MILGAKGGKVAAKATHIQRALEQLLQREVAIGSEVAHLEALRREAQDIARHQEILIEALAKMKGHGQLTATAYSRD